MSQGTFFDVGNAKAFHESETQQQQALAVLRHRKLTKVSFEQDWQNQGARLAPAIEVLRNGWGFEIAGNGTSANPYWLLNRNQFPTKVRTTESLKEAYYNSEHWERTRELRFQNDNYRCVICSEASVAGIECHHLRYDLFNEKQDDLMTVCKAHHELIHRESRIGFPIGLELWVVERLLGVVTYEFPGWLLP